MKSIYQFLYCYCIYESAYGTMSVHATAKGAYKAMKEHRLKVFNEWRNSPNQYRKSFIDTVHQDWTIQKIDVHE